MFNSILDLIGLAALLPFFGVILTPGFIQENEWLRLFYELLNFQSETNFIIFLSLLILGIIITKNLIGLWINYIQGKFTWTVYHHLATKMLRGTYDKGYLYFTNNNSNKIFNNIVYSTELFCTTLVQKLIIFINELLILIFICISLMVYDYKIILILISTVVPVYSFFYYITKGEIQEIGRKQYEIAPHIKKPIFEIIFGINDVIINNSFRSFSDKFSKAVKDISRYKIRGEMLTHTSPRLMEVAVIMAVLILMLYGVLYIKDRNMIITLIGIFGLAAYRAIPTINRMMIAIMSIKSAQHIFPVLETIREIKVIDNKDEISFNSRIELDGLSFQYPNTQTYSLSNVSFTIKRGESIGLIGKSGSGKTTLMNVLLQFVTQTSGDIKLDGKPLSLNNLPSWRKKIGYVSQDVFLIDGSVAENIAFGMPHDELDEAMLNKVIEQASLKEVIDNLENGIHHAIGERGVKLSGGQRQRLGIARALYSGAEILFFDEATSALDSVTEGEITESIRKLSSSDLTMFIIAHRITTLKYCDRIIEMSEGVVVGESDYNTIYQKMNK